MQTMGSWRSETASGTRGGARLTEAFVRIITGFDPLSMARAKRKYLAGPGREPGFQDRQFAAASALLRRQQYSRMRRITGGSAALMAETWCASVLGRYRLTRRQGARTPRFSSICVAAVFNDLSLKWSWIPIRF